MGGATRFKKVLFLQEDMSDATFPDLLINLKNKTPFPSRSELSGRKSRHHCIP